MSPAGAARRAARLPARRPRGAGQARAGVASSTARAWIDEVIPYRVGRSLAGVADRRRVVADDPPRRFDLAVLFPRSFESAFWATLARVPRRVGFAADGARPLLTRKALRATRCSCNSTRCTTICTCCARRSASTAIRADYRIDVEPRHRAEHGRVARRAPPPARPAARARARRRVRPGEGMAGGALGGAGRPTRPSATAPSACWSARRASGRAASRWRRASRQRRADRGGRDQRRPDGRAAVALRRDSPATTPAPCTSPARSASRPSASSARPIRSAPARSARTRASSTTASTAARAWSAPAASATTTA